jgi:hypothetical protein
MHLHRMQSDYSTVSVAPRRLVAAGAQIQLERRRLGLGSFRNG